MKRVRGRLSRLRPSLRRTPNAEEPEAAEPEAAEPESPRLGDLHENRREAIGRRLSSLRQRSRPTASSGPGLRKRLATLAGGAGSALASAAGAVRHGFGVAGGRVSDAWFILPIEIRQRLAAGAALVLLVVLVAFVVIPNAPCGFPGGDRCPPSDDTIALAPADAGAYLHINLDPGTDQYEAAQKLTEKLPTVTDTVTSLLPSLTGTELNYEADVRPWSGGEVAVVLGGSGLSGLEPELSLFEIADTEGALQFAADLQGPGTTESEVKGITVRSTAELSSAIVEGLLLLGDEAAVTAAIERAADPAAQTLANNPEADRALGELPDERLIDVYVSLDLADALREDGTLGAFNTFVNAGATEGFAAALVLGESSISLAVRSLQDPELEAESAFASLPAFEPKLPESINEDAYLYLGLGDPGGSARSLIEQAASVSRPLQRSLKAFTRRLGRTGGPDVDSELLPLLDGESALTVEPKTRPGDEGGDTPEGGTPGLDGGIVAPPYLGLLADEIGGEQALSAIAGLQAPIAAAIDPSNGQSPVFETRDIDGVEAQSLRLSPSVDLTYASFDDRLVVGSDPIAIARAREVKDSLAGSNLYEDAVSGLPDEVALLLYLDVPDLLALGEEVLQLPLVPAYAALAPDLRALDAAAVGVVADDDLLASDVRIEVGEPMQEAETAPAPIQPG